MFFFFCYRGNRTDHENLKTSRARAVKYLECFLVMRQMSRSKKLDEKKTLLKQINVKKHARIKINSLRLQSFDDVPLKQSQKPKNLPCTKLYGRIFCGQHEQHNTCTVRRRKSILRWTFSLCSCLLSWSIFSPSSLCSRQNQEFQRQPQPSKFTCSSVVSLFRTLHHWVCNV